MIAFLYDLIYMLLITVASAVMGRPYLNPPEKVWLFYGLAVLLPIIVAGVRHVEKKYKFFLIGLPAVIAVGAILVVKRGERAQFIHDNLWVLWILLIAVGAYFASKLLSMSKWVRRVAGIVIAVVMLYAVHYRVLFSNVEAALLIVFILLFVVEEVQLKWKKSGYTDGKAHLVSVAPFIIIIAVAVGVIRTPDKPYDWKLFINIAEGISDGFDKAVGMICGQEDDYGIIGFSEEGSILNLIGNSDKKVMSVTRGADAGSSAYLSGRVFDTFDGRGWTVENDLACSAKMMDTLETQCSVRTYAEGNFTDYLARTNLQLKCLTKSTQHMFMPPKAILTGKRVSDIPYDERIDAVYAKRNLRYGDIIEIDFYRMNRDAKGFENYIVNAQPFSRDEWGTVTRSYSFSDSSAFTYEAYLDYKSAMSKVYCQDVQLSDELRAVMDKVYEGTQSDYEKMERLEAFLGKLTYNTAPGVMPDKVKDATSYLDYFILEKKEGYCVHFATAFALLARAEGLPSRYNQGYSVTGMKNEAVIVKSNRAHAWPEVYFENVGWVYFEPTPGYQEDNKWLMRSEKEEELEEKSDYYSNHPEAEESTEHDVSEGESGEVIPEKRINIKVVLIPVLAAIAFIAIYIFISSFIAKVQYSRLDNEGKILFLSRRNIKRLSRLGHKMKPGETLQEYTVRIIDAVPEDALEFIMYYEKLSYSDMVATDEMLIEVETSSQQLRAWMKKNRHYLLLLS